MDHFFRNGEWFASHPQDFVHPSCPLHLIVMNINIKPREEVVWEERFNLLNHLSIDVLESFEKGEEDLYLLIGKIILYPVFVTLLCMNDIPLFVCCVYCVRCAHCVY